MKHITHESALKELAQVNEDISLIGAQLQAARNTAIQATNPNLRQIRIEHLEDYLQELNARRLELVNELVNVHGLAREWVWQVEDEAAQR